MPHRIKIECPICGEERLPLPEPKAKACEICHKPYEADSVCTNHHFVCHMCRQKAVRDKIMAHCLQSEATDPFALEKELMKLPGVLMHGPEHHLLTTAALLTAYANQTGRTDLAGLLGTANNRTIEVPGAACGFWGICGAAIGAGIFISILTETGPLSTDTWKTTGQLTARCADVISAQGGPRCCKRDSFLSLREAIKYSNEIFQAGFSLPEDMTCEFYINNRECKGKACEFFPVKSQTA